MRVKGKGVDQSIDERRRAVLLSSADARGAVGTRRARVL